MFRTALAAIGRPHIDVTLASGPEFMVRIVETPALWMTPEDLSRLSADLRAIATQTLPAGALTYGVFAAEPEAMSGCVITLVTRRDGTPVAFNALPLLRVEAAPRPVDVLHLGLVMVAPDVQSRQLSWVLYGLTCFLIFMRHQFRPVWISSVTQVPAVVGMVEGMFSDVWPGPAAGRRSLTQLLIARRIMADHRAVFGVGPEAEFDEDRFVITNAYTGGSDHLKKSWEAAPKHRRDAVNAYCAEALDYERGDDVLQLGRMDMAAMRRYLAREVPRGARGSLIVAGGVLALQRLILPLIHWFDAGKPWSILRPSR